MSNNPRYGTNSQNTSKYMTDLLNEFIKMPRGVFNLTRRKIFDTIPYAINPIESWEMLPNSDLYIKYDIQVLSKVPTIKKLLSSMNAEIRIYKVNYNDCWEGWNNFITKGRSGKVEKSIPYVDLSLNSDDVTTCLPYNPMSILRHAPEVFLATGGTGDVYKFQWPLNNGVQLLTNLQSSGKTGLSTLSGLKASTAMRVNALPYVAYNKIAKEYQTSNLLQNNPHWYPENENHDMILPYSATGAVTTSDYDNPTKGWVTGTSKYFPDQVNTGTDDAPVYESYPWLNCMWYSQRKGDYFNTGSPFPDLVRGDIPTLQMLQSSIDWSKVAGYSNGPINVLGIGPSIAVGQGSVIGTIQSNPGASGYEEYTNKLLNLHTGSSGGTLQNAGLSDPNDTNHPLSIYGGSDTYGLLGALNKAELKGLEFSMSQWRYLATMTVLRERLALTDGSYNELIKAMFGHNPRWHNHNAIYCGGTRQPIVFTEVVNSAESASAPLGDVAGRAVSSSNHDVIHVHSDDYAVMMAVLVVTPDEYYSQGVDKMWSRLENAEQYLPILNNLSPDATKNKELYVSGTNSTDEDVFNYQERFAYYKSRRNEVAGLLSLAISKIGDAGAWVSQRIFGSTPQFNSEFSLGVRTENEKAIWSSVNEAPFNFVIGSNMRYVAPIPEDSRPSDMGISY